MNLKLLSTAAVALCLIGAPAIAQESNAVPPNTSESTQSGNNAQSGETMTPDAGTTGAVSGNWASDNERMMYEDNRDMWAGFFTDDTMSSAKSEAEVRETFAAMGADSQGQIKAACDRVDNDRGSYGTVTQGLCSQIGAM